MSHDRGCSCGKESYEYKDCTERSCNKVGNKNITREALVFIGRFQPFHIGHESVIQEALKQAKQVVVVVGSSFTARTTKNPFTFAERKQMIKAVFPTDRVVVVPVGDFPYDDTKWVAAVQSAVTTAIPSVKDIGLIGHSKDSSSYYLKIFPQWKKHVEVEDVSGINATDIRKALLGNNKEQLDVSTVVSKTVYKLLATIIADGPDGYADFWLDIRTEFMFNEKYKEAWKSAPFPPTFVTVDSVVVQSGHVLLVTRKKSPGRGLWALPGGFLNQEEAIEDAMIRELVEETQIKLQPQVLKGSIAANAVFDKPDRDPRGRTITHAYYLQLKDMETLPHIKGADDAEKAEWVPINMVLQNRDRFYADHFHIIAHFLKIG